MKQLFSRFGFVVLFVMALLISHTAMAQKVTFSGTVKNAHRVLEGASVELVGKGIVVYTNTNGVFVLKVTPGNYVAEVSYGDYKTKKVNLQITASKANAVVVELDGNYELLSLAQVGSISTTKRKAGENVSAVDVVCSKTLQIPGHVEPSQILNYNLASFNSSRQTLAGGTDHIDPSTLRGLGTDNMLVLVNGQRRHASSLTNINQTLGRGTTSYDFNSIPLSAIERVEILRDGAVAQYGSDAIGGVINIVLKQDVKQTNLNLHVGQQYLGDGLTKAVNANHAMKLGKKGFLDLFADLRFREATNRSGEYEGTVYSNNLVLDNILVEERKFNRAGNLRLGNSQADNYNLGFNLGFPLSSKVNFTANYLSGYRKSVAGGMYYYPKQTDYVNYFVHPDGFLPLNEAKVRDRSIAAKVNGICKKGWNWELATVFGENGINYNVSNSNNASQLSLGASVPTNFYNGKTKYNQSSNTVTFNKDLGKKLNIQSFNLAFGGEYRNENYAIGAGDEASWNDYASANTQIGGATGFTGFAPVSVVSKMREMVGGFANVETDLSKEFLLTAAVRYDNYLNDIKGLFAGKLAGRYKFSDNFSVRASLSNGYKAPALQQQYFSYFTYVPTAVSGRKLDVIAANNSVAASLFGIEKLKAEKSMQYGLGFSTTPFKNKKINIAVDAYQIVIDDRIALTDKFDRTTSTVVNNLFTALPSYQSVSFLANTAKTTTQGIDATLSANENKFMEGLLDVSISVNLNKTEVNNVNVPSVIDDAAGNGLVKFFSGAEYGRLELAQPRNKAILGLTYRANNWIFNSRFTYFGGIKTTDNSYYLGLVNETFSERLVTDASLSYKPIHWMTFTLGANNIGNVYPSKLANAANTAQGLIPYSVNATQFGFNGGYWYTNLAFDLTNIKCVKKVKAAPVAPMPEVKKVEAPKDTDGDGVPDKEDKCPIVAGVKYLNGCPDKDGDGVTDAEDKCPTVPGYKVFAGCPDTDGDGIEDSKDKCPTQPGVARLDGCPVPDTDGDGLNDDYDKCPTVKGTIANNGCPDEVKVEVQKKLDLSARMILFETGSAVITKSSYKVLDEVAALLNNNASFSLNIEGHTDNTGDETKNVQLSQKRADVVKAYLAKKGVKEERMTAQGFGSAKPVADNATTEGKHQNRRVELVLQ